MSIKHGFIPFWRVAPYERTSGSTCGFSDPSYQPPKVFLCFLDAGFTSQQALPHRSLHSVPLLAVQIKALEQGIPQNLSGRTAELSGATRASQVPQRGYPTGKPSCSTTIPQGPVVSFHGSIILKAISKNIWRWATHNDKDEHLQMVLISRLHLGDLCTGLHSLGGTPNSHIHE